MNRDTRVLDVAYGTGIVGLLASEKIGLYWNVYFVDLSINIINAALR